jgi:hypothetical protein
VLLSHYFIEIARPHARGKRRDTVASKRHLTSHPQ